MLSFMTTALETQQIARWTLCFTEANILLEFHKSCITGPLECLQACMGGLEPVQVLMYPFLDMSSPHLCDCLKITRESRNPIILRHIEPVGKLIPALA